jgi:hypothetical protein
MNDQEQRYKQLVALSNQINSVMHVTWALLAVIAMELIWIGLHLR